MARLDLLPPRVLPILYLGGAHLSLVAAFAAAAATPATLTQFHYQPRTLALVHLVTLGWISLSILGATYIIGPMALRMPMPSRGCDYAAFALVLVGALGMIGHFLISGYGGLSWSAGLVVAGTGHVAVRVWRGLWTAPIDRAVKLHVALAYFNLIAAGAAGLLIGLNKAIPFLPSSPLSLAYGHAHLAAIGWATMMVAGTGYRLLPMVLPSALPRGRGLYVSVLLLQAGAWGLFAAFASAVRLLPLFALMTIAGIVAFLLRVAWMRRNPRRPPIGLKRPDYGALHALQALGYAGLCALCGLLLSLAPAGSASGRLAAVYGLLGLVGFLAQIVLGIGARILPMFAAYHANLNACAERPPALPHHMASRALQAATFYAWTGGVPVLAAGLWLQAATTVLAGALLLLAASLMASINAARIFGYAFRRGLPLTRPSGGRPPDRAAPPATPAG